MGQKYDLNFYGCRDLLGGTYSGPRWSASENGLTLDLDCKAPGDFVGGKVFGMGGHGPLAACGVSDSLDPVDILPVGRFSP